MGLFHGAATWARALGRGLETHIDGAAGATAGFGSLFLWNGHWLTLPRRRAGPEGRRVLPSVHRESE